MIRFYRPHLLCMVMYYYNVKLAVQVCEREGGGGGGG